MSQNTSHKIGTRVTVRGPRGYANQCGTIIRPFSWMVEAGYSGLYAVEFDRPPLWANSARQQSVYAHNIRPTKEQTA